MNRSFLSIVVGVGLIFLAHPASAQLPAAKPKTPLNNTASSDKSDAKADADRIRKERQSQARSLLISLASDARSFRDQTLRARSLARIADALWGVDAEQGRTLFRKAWEAAETADRESQERLNISGGVVKLKPAEITPETISSIVLSLDLRREVLKLAARRDRLLGEEFLQKLKADQQETKSENSRRSLWDLPDALQQRLSLAEGLLRTGDIERALQFADPVLGSVTISTLEFLTLLREKDPAAADQRYAAMLANTGGNIAADANTISLLSSYIFTPQTYVIFNTEGVAEWSQMPSSSPASVGPQLRLAFLQTAASVFLRPQPPPEQDQGTAGIAGKYMVVKRLMPLFEQYAPQEITAAMRGQFEALNSLVSDGVRQGENEWVQKGISPEKSLADQEQPLLDDIERAKTSDERDQLYFRLALLALSKDDMRARDYVSEIAESGFRKQAQAWVDVGLAISAIDKKKIETALELARIGELTHIQRVWILTQAAKLLAKTDHDKALSLLDDATAEARRIEGVDLDRPRGLLAIANALRLVEPPRVWDAIFDAVKAANSTEGFTGEDGALTLTLNSKGQIRVSPNPVPDFDIEGIFGKLANDDYDRVVQLARGFQGEAPRANATIAIARSVLNEKSAPVPMPQPATKN
jgi:hypothetical protein